MSLYNSIFGQNPIAPLLLKMIGVDQPDGEWHSGRFRDIFLNENGTEIHLYTRNGGGNREHWSFSHEGEGGENCECAGCVITYHLPKHPQYLRDIDDSFDCTFATIVFKTPEKYLANTKELATGKLETGDDKWKRFFEEMEKGESSPEVVRALKVGKKIFKEMEKGNGGVIKV